MLSRFEMFAIASFLVELEVVVALVGFLDDPLSTFGGCSARDASGTPLSARLLL